MVLKNLFTGQQWRETDIENRLMDLGKGQDRVRCMETYITICKIANGNLLYGSGNSNRGSVST